VVVKPVPDNCTVVGIPGRIVRGGATGEKDVLEHGMLPDPEAQRADELQKRMEELEASMRTFEANMQSLMDRRQIPDRRRAAQEVSTNGSGAVQEPVRTEEAPKKE